MEEPAQSPEPEITLTFPLSGVNRLLSLLGKLPFEQVNNAIQEIVLQAEPQVTKA